MEILPAFISKPMVVAMLRRVARLKVFSGLVRADRWRIGGWRLAAQQQKRERREFAA
jgi:hypothetical protein